MTGRTLRFLGYALATGCGSLLLKHFVIAPGPPVGHIPWVLRLLIMLGILEGGWLVFRASRRVVVRGRRHRVRVLTGFEELRGERYILYLRPFALDIRMSLPPPEAPGWWMRSPYELPGLTMEDFLVRQFTRHGRVVAVGEPGEELPLLGAQRGYLPLEGWERTVSELIQGAHSVLMSVAPGPGTVWEFTEALRTMPPERLVLMVCCGPEDYDAFRRPSWRSTPSGNPRSRAALGLRYHGCPTVPRGPRPRSVSGSRPSGPSSPSTSSGSRACTGSS
ncbi:hypothetical protein [Streptomyces anthocyanicus]|uniref:hypothetical protein n=1 Tax=Streptomyces anthocyanicus TaxID=68174 RepID=UPI003872B581|nr:hypothetical protein OG855_00065 [Streptomyces anthocyanicus]WTC53384.1 hypothetical protein OG855_39045 [Streptomyces anthocyanicus]